MTNGFKDGEAVAETLNVGGPGEREPRLARRSPFARSARLCPRCLTPMEPIKNPIGELWGIMPTNYECSKCGYAGTVFLEKEPETGKGKE